MHRPASTCAAAIGACALAMVAGCATTNLHAIDQAGFQPEVDERQLWEGAAKLDGALNARGALYEDAALQQYLEGVTTRLAPNLVGAERPVHVHVLRDPYLNAFALPNGSLYLHTGLLASIDNEAQLATVIGHELTHFTERHGLKTQRTAENRAAAMQVVFGILAVAAAGASGNANAARAILDLGKAVSPTIVEVQVKGYSRDLEREADARGFAMLTTAGYDTREAPRVFAVLQSDATESGIEEPFFFGNHPRLAERIENYQDLLAEGPAAPAAAGRVGRDEFAAAVAQLRLDDAKMNIAIGRTDRARRAIEHSLAFQPRSAQAVFLLGETQRRAGDVEGARRFYEQAAHLDPTYAAPHRELGLLYRAAADPAAARAAFARYLELAPQATDRPIIQAYRTEAGTPE